MNRFGRRTSTLALGIFFLTTASTVEAGAEKLWMPLIVVNAGVPVTSDEIDGVVAGLDAPMRRGQALLDEMDVVLTLEQHETSGLTALFAAAEDLFFNGHHREATAKFSKIVEWASTHPEGLLLGPVIRDTVFKTHIHMAVIAAGDDTLVEEHLNAATRFRDLSPSENDFPPWVCERFRVARASRVTSTRQIATISVPKECRSILVGDTIGEISGTEAVFPGDGFVQTFCEHASSPVQRITLTRGSNVVAPLILTETTLNENEGAPDLTLTASPDFDETSLTEDLRSMLAAVEQHRLVAIVGRGNELEVWLVDSRSEHPLRTASVPRNDPVSARRAGRSVAEGPEVEAPGSTPTIYRPWYRDPAAWTLVGTGAVLIGVGATLHSVYGRETISESVSLAAMVSGGGLMGTGFVLFFFPVETAPTDKKSARTIPLVGMTKRF